MIEECFEMIEQFLRGEYEPLGFSYDLEDFLYHNGNLMEKENKRIEAELQEYFPEICAEYVVGDDPEPFRIMVENEYNRILNAAGIKRKEIKITVQKVFINGCFSQMKQVINGDDSRYGTDFPLHFENYLCSYNKFMEEEDAAVNAELQRDLPQICKEHYDTTNLEAFRIKLKEEYERLISLFGHERIKN